jgi:hypothetical protein
MTNEPPDNDSSNTQLLLPEPAGNLYATAYDPGLDKVMETIERKQKILAKNICVPGKKTYIVDWMKQTYAILLEADPHTIIKTPSGLKIDNLTTFPSGKKFQNAFTPIQSEDTKQITMNFYLTMAPALNRVKAKHQKLLDHLQKHKIYIQYLVGEFDTYFSMKKLSRLNRKLEASVRTPPSIRYDVGG